jgi:integrase
MQRLCTVDHEDAPGFIKSVLTQDVEGIPLWEKHPVQAKEIHNNMHRIMERAWANGYLAKGDYLATDMKGKLGKLLVPHKKFYKSTPHPALKWKEAGQFMAVIRARDGGRLSSGIALEFLTLTGVRKSQVAMARWDEFYDDYWKCSKHKTDKTGQPYEVFLSSQAIDVLEKMKAIRVNEYVFPGGKGSRHGHINRKSIDHFMKRELNRQDITRHGMHTAIQSFARSRGFRDVVLDQVINHSAPGLMPTYARHADVEPELRQLMT